MSLTLRQATRLRPKCTVLARTVSLRLYSAQNGQQEAATSSSWTPVHKPGQHPLYDMALKVIEEDSKKLRAQAERLARETPAQKDKLEELEVLSEMNRPEVLWAVENGKGDMSKPVFRYLAKRHWQERGKLDHLMQRIHTMSVVPDLLADFHPSLDLSISCGSESHVEVGTFVEVKKTIQQPLLHVKAFHKEERYYTLVMVDPDAPDVRNQTYRTYLHWLVPNIRLSSTTSSPISLLGSEETSVPYIPPHPQNGTPYHRYCIFLLENPDPQAKIDISSVSAANRNEFDLRAFIAQHAFKPERAGGAHFWRETWDPAVSDIYRDTLDVPEPRYGRPPKIDRYEEVKRMKRYI
ncbi:hypothetical protein M408DRAFT_183496 [Serendipita vermifera MAFF 305830]|uniref:PEBP-like protein n=1 Tax=Serendipita vermifera MAFF 305830 TaxID=933852 RepID=A0A0C3BKK8_SERVB|nr:hypothetical protein M408DRAFT_183496 [Serendipita vermifera MAFF 305830]